MKRLIVLLLLIPSLCFAVEPIDLARINVGIVGGGTPAAASPCQGANPSDCTFRETFDSDQACGDGSHTNCVAAWTQVSGWVDFNAGSAPQGTYQASSAGATVVNRRAFTAGNEYYAAAIMSFTDVTTGTASLALKDGSGNNLCNLQFSSGKLSVGNSGGTAAEGSATFSTGTTYYLKIRAKAVGVGSSECEFWSSTNGTAWTHDTAESTNGTWTAQVARVYMQANTAAGTITYDDVRVYTGDISY